MSISGSPAATSEPNASTRIASVTGQLNSSDFIIAVRFAVLKSLHIPDAPVSETVTPEAPAACSFDFSLSATATIAVGSPFAPAITIAVCPSAEIVAPGRGATIEATFGLVWSTCVTRATVALNAGSAVVCAGEWTTTISAELESPPKLSWIRFRACTDSEPFACQPAPESAVSTFGAKKPNPTAITTQAIATARK